MAPNFCIFIFVVSISLISVHARHGHQNDYEVINKLLDRLQNLQKRQELRNERLDKLKKWKDDMERQLGNLEQKNLELRQMNSNLTSHVQAMSDRAAKLKARNEALKKNAVPELKVIDRVHGKHGAKLQSLVGNEAPQCIHGPPVLCDSSKIIAFHVGGHPEVDGSMRPTDVWLNIGNAYNPLNGYFWAPVRGVYSFSYNALADEDVCFVQFADFAQVVVYVNGFVHSGSYSMIEMSGGSAFIVELDAGDGLNFSLVQHGCTDLADVSTYNTFSGHLLYEIE